MLNIKFYVVLVLLLSVLITLFLIYRKNNKVKKESVVKENKIKNDLKSLREKLSKSNDPNTKNEIINKINIIIDNFKK